MTARAVLWALLFGAACAALVLVLALRGNDLRVEFTLASDTGTQGELFHSTDGAYAPARSVPFAILPGKVAHRYSLDVASRVPLRAIRVDIGTGPGPIVLHGLTVAGSLRGMTSGVHALPLQSARLNDAVRSADDGAALHLRATGGDPYIDLTLPPAVVAAITRWHRTTAVALAAAAALLGVLLAWLALTARAGLRRAFPSGLRWPTWLHRLGATASDDATIRFDPPATLAVALAVLLGGIGVAANLNFSSVGMWDAYLPPAADAPASTLIGTPRAIRSDEWLVQTPWMLSQASHGLPVANANVGGERSPLLTSVPVAHPAAVLQPEFWGFALFDAERAIAWFWMFKVVGLFLSAFLLLMLLTRSDTAVSLAGATWLGLSSYTQWWFSSNLTEILIGFCLALVGLAYTCLSRRSLGIAGGLVLLLLGAATFVLQLYPPYQVPLGYLALVLVAATVAEPARRAAFRERARLRIACLLVAAAVMAGVLGAVWLDGGATIDAIGQTVYPGKRSFVGGDMTWWRLFDGLFEGWRIGEEVHPYPASNASESSNFVLLFPLALAAMFAARRSLARDRQPLLLALGAFCCLLAAWMTITLPSPLANGLAKATLLSYVAPLRALPALAVASILLCATWIAWQRRRGPGQAVHVPAWVGVVAVVVAYHVGAVLAGHDRAYFTGWRIMLGCVVVGLAFLAIGRGRAKPFVWMVLLVAAPAVTVNPLARGLGPLLDKPVLQAARDAGGAGGTRWIIAGGGILPQAFKASGLDVLGGPTFLPDRKAMAAFDPSGASRAVWDRYAHVVIDSRPGLPAATFELLHPDIYRITLDFCSTAVDQAGITHVAFPGPAPAGDARCLQPLRKGPVDGLWLYRRVAPAPAR